MRAATFAAIDGRLTNRVNTLSGNVIVMTGVVAVNMNTMTFNVAARLSGRIDTMTDIVDNILSGNLNGLSGRITVMVSGMVTLIMARLTILRSNSQSVAMQGE